MKRRNQATRKNHYRKVTGGGPTKTPYEIDEFNKRYSELFALLRQIEPAVNKCILAFASNLNERKIINKADQRESRISLREAAQSHREAAEAAIGIRSMISQSNRTKSNRGSPKQFLRSSSLQVVHGNQPNRITHTINRQQHHRSK